MQTKSLYIASLEPAAGSIVVTMGLMELLTRRVERVAFFRPVIECHACVDGDIMLILQRYGIDMEYEACYGYTLQDAEALIAEGRLNFLLERLVERFNTLLHAYDFVVCQGLSVTSFSSALDFDLNLEIARNFTSPVVTVLSGKGRSAKELMDTAKIESAAVASESCVHFATFINRLSPEAMEQMRAILEKENLTSPTYLLSELDELDKPTMWEVQNALKCERLLGTDEDMNRVVNQCKIAAMSLEHFLERLEEGDLVIVPGDRADILIGTLVSTYSPRHANAAGIILTGGFVPGQHIIDIINNLSYLPVPILTVPEGTLPAAMKILSIPAKITAENRRKAALAMGLFDRHVNTDEILERIALTGSSVMTPIMFEYSLFERARTSRKHIILPESLDERILRAVEILLRREAVDITLLGKEDEIRHKSASLGLDISSASIIDPEHSALKAEFSERFYELRKARGLSREVAEDTMNMPTYFATMMVYCGYADGMVSGAVHTTQETIRPALQTIKTKPGVSIVSSVFFMCLEAKVLVYGDCAVNPDPNAEELAEIAISSADTARIFGIEPRVAMLSYSTGESGKGAEVEKVREATRIAKARRPELMIEGPIQYDAAVDMEVAKKKLPGSSVAGQANVFIFPDLNTGNNTYKAVQRSSGAIAIGPVLQGLNKPVNDLSRGCEVADIVNTVVITAIQAQNEAQL